MSIRHSQSPQVAGTISPSMSRQVQGTEAYGGEVGLSPSSPYHQHSCTPSAPPDDSGSDEDRTGPLSSDEFSAVQPSRTPLGRLLPIVPPPPLHPLNLFRSQSDSTALASPHSAAGATITRSRTLPLQLHPGATGANRPARPSLLRPKGPRQQSLFSSDPSIDFRRLRGEEIEGRGMPPQSQSAQQSATMPSLSLAQQPRPAHSQEPNYVPAPPYQYLPPAPQPDFAPIPPPFQHHNSEGTNGRISLPSSPVSPVSPSNGTSRGWKLRSSSSTSNLPSPSGSGSASGGRKLSKDSTTTGNGRRNSNLGSVMEGQRGVNWGTGSAGGEAYAFQNGGASGSRSPPNGLQQQAQRQQSVGVDKDLEAAMRASAMEAELVRAQEASVQAEEDRLLKFVLAASSYSAEQEALRAERLAAEKRAELEALQKAIMQSEAEKGKRRARESSVERQEREAIAYATALSISEMQHRRITQRETSAEMWGRLSRPTGEDVDVGGGPRSTSPTGFAPPSPPSAPTARVGRSNSRFFVSNPDSAPPFDAPPPAYEYPQPDDNPRSVVLGPGRPLPRPPATRPALSTHSSSSHSATASTSTSRPLPHSRQSSFSNPTTPDVSANAASYYSASVAASLQSRPSIMVDSSPKPTRQDSYSSSVAVMVNTPSVMEDDIEDPFDDSHAEQSSSPPGEVDDEESQQPQPAPTQDLWELTHRPHGKGKERSTSTSPGPQARDLSGSVASMTISGHSSPSLLSPAISLADRRASPLFGGLVDFSSANAIPDEEITRGVKFGFVTGSHRRAPLEHDGGFPDVAQLSRVGAPEGGRLDFECFAVEARGWQALLSYLMWHGNSHFEAAPSDLQSEKSGVGLECAIVLDFFRSPEDRQPKVRCRLTLLPPLHQYNPLSDESSSYSTFDIEQPSIVIPLPGPPTLPLKLSTLATTLSAAHTLSRRSRSDLRSNSFAADCRPIRDLAQAVDLFKTLNGETVVHDAEEVQMAEDNWLSSMKIRLRRKKRGPGIVKGGADGTGSGRPIEGNMALPEGALLVTPFRLDDT